MATLQSLGSVAGLINLDYAGALSACTDSE